MLTKNDSIFPSMESDQLMEQQQALAGSKQTKHRLKHRLKLKEMLYRVR